jgi:hypothetical protein
MNRVPPEAIYSRALEKSQELDRSSRGRCKPGYTYNATIDKCLPGNPYYIADMDISDIFPGQGGGNGGNKGQSGGDMPKMPKNPGKNKQNADVAIKQEMMMRQSQGLE